MIGKDIIDHFRVDPDKKFKLKDHDPGWVHKGELKELGKETEKERAEQFLQASILELAKAQELLYADNRFAVLIVLQAMDAAGKDGTIKHVMSGINPQGCEVHSFKAPSAEELEHTFLWRHERRVPGRGRIGIFNRSYYEDVLVVKVHPELLEQQRLPSRKRGKGFWQARYDDINAFERHLVRNGTLIVKFFLNISKEEQKKRFLARLDQPDKNWKFSPVDLKERAFWDDYMQAYQDAINATSTKWAPWYVVPADNKWVSHEVIANILTNEIQGLDLKYPKVGEDQKEAQAEARKELEE